MFLARKHLNLSQTIASALTPLRGIGLTRFRLIMTRFSRTRKSMLDAMNKHNVYSFASNIDKSYSTDEQVLKIEIKRLRKHLKNGSYRGIRMLQGLPSHGQRTHTNHSTARKMKVKYYKIIKRSL